MEVGHFRVLRNYSLIVLNSLFFLSSSRKTRGNLKLVHHFFWPILISFRLQRNTSFSKKDTSNSKILRGQWRNITLIFDYMMVIESRIELNTARPSFFKSIFFNESIRGWKRNPRFFSLYLEKIKRIKRKWRNWHTRICTYMRMKDARPEIANWILFSPRVTF